MTGCHVMAKPASSRCNLRCRYCFYLDKTQQPTMDDATLERFIVQHIDAQPGHEVQFAWQGGEPTLCGLDFFRRVAALQHRYANGKRIRNAFQTNGILLNEEWCQFFHDNGWLVGISLDGPADLHDSLRISRTGNPTHHKVLRAIGMLRACEVEFNLLVVVNSHNSQYPKRMYRYLRALGTAHLQFIPLMELDEHQHPDEHSVDPKAWGNFLCRVFDIWVREDIGRVFIQLFDSTLGVWSGFASQMCSLSETCGHAFALEANGDLYQCDHYVYPAFRLGNIHTTTLGEMNTSSAAFSFGQYKMQSLVETCKRCPVLRLCHGDCPKHRDGSGKSALCDGYRDFFTHSAPHMRVMRDLIAQHRSPMELMTMLAHQRS
ncbi:anaerobic sulfatase maturase [Atlantibacter subterranea]|uniref:Anaerobic sulfatase maturase n=1 Tax=Atlantibacter subterraneus TaxID=255519 RepID=A0ABU4E6V0_9ENTR|nr:anaerobic sulfatase maturase [Atlantibacter subterranea]MDV7024853.1 anaerobic sulfatase maturase [Atlantibacter subterranea]MDZ5668095.1 anaerobic sulfatase maturase [Atlantibacter hermannii]